MLGYAISMKNTQGCKEHCDGRLRWKIAMEDCDGRLRWKIAMEEIDELIFN